MFWLPVKGPVYWKHTSFPMFSFLSLFSPFCFSQSALPRALGEDVKLKVPPQGGEGDGIWDSQLHLRSHVDRGTGQRGDPRSRMSSAIWSWGQGQVLSLPE